MSHGQFSLTYKTPYSQNIARQIAELQARKEHFYPEQPDIFPANYQSAGLGNPYAQVAMSGGGLTGNEKYLQHGTSEAYPQYNMDIAMNTASAGRMVRPMCASCCGGRKCGGDALGDLKDFGIGLAKDLIRAKLMGGDALGDLKDFGISLAKDMIRQKLLGAGMNEMDGGAITDDIIHSLTSIAPYLLGLGRKPRVKKGGDALGDLKDFGISLAKDMIRQKLMGAGMPEMSAGDIGSDIIHGLTSLAPILMMGLGRKGRKSGGAVVDSSVSRMVGGLSLGDVKNFGKSVASRTLGELKDVGNAILPEAKQIAKELAVDAIKKQVGKGRRGRPKKSGAGAYEDLLKVQKGLRTVGSVFNVVGLPNPADIGEPIGEAIGKPLRKAIRGYGRKKGSKSKTHKGELDYTTKKGDLVYHQKGKYVRKSDLPYTTTGGYSFADLGKDLGLQDVGKEIVKDMIKSSISGGAKSVGADKRRARGEIVKKIMKEKGLSLPQASKYVKEHGLA